MKPGLLGLLAVALLLFASFALLSRRAAEGSRVARVAALVDGALLILAGVQALFAAVVLFALKCDETCADSGERPGDWSDRADAWQWWAQLRLPESGSRRSSSPSCTPRGADTRTPWRGWLARRCASRSG